MSKSPTTTGSSGPLGLAQMRRPPTHPGVVLTEQLQALGVSAAEAGRRIGVSKAQMSHVTTGLKPMPHTMCVKLGALLGTSAEFWATLQMRHDLWHAMQDPATKKTVKAIAPLVERATAFAPGDVRVEL